MRGPLPPGHGDTYPSAKRWLALIALSLFGICLGSNRALTDHEALLAGSTKEMVLSGDWLLLKIGDQPWLEKPPLPQWLAALSAIEFGTFNEWTMRIPFALAGVVVVLIVTRCMTTLLGRELGLIAGLVQATSVYQVTYARLAEADVILQVFVLGAIATFVELEVRGDSLDDRQQQRLRWMFWILLGCTNLAKGIAFGAVLTLLTCAGWLLLQRDWQAWRRWWSPGAMATAILIGLAWPIAVVVRDPEALTLWQKHTFGRAAGSIGYTEPVWYYLTTWPVQLLPWTPFLLVAIPLIVSRIRADRRSPEAFLVWWAVCQPALLTLSSGKHHHYLIYALPACSGLIALGLQFSAQRLRAGTREWQVWQPLLWCASISTLLAAGTLAIRQPELRLDALCLGLLFTIGCAALAITIRQRATRAVGLTLAIMIIGGHIYAQAVVLPQRDPSRADREFLAEVEQLVPSETPLVASGCQEIARHIFYVDRPVIGIWNPPEIAGHLAGSEDYYVIARGTAKGDLAQQGHVEQVLQSRYTRRERNADDRYTLFRVHPAPVIAVEAIPQRQ